MHKAFPAFLIARFNGYYNTFMAYWYPPITPAHQAEY